MNELRVTLLAAGFTSIDYVELVGSGDLSPMTELDRSARLLAAAWMGTTRLIDNVGIAAQPTQN